MEFKLIELEDDLTIEVKCNISEEQLGDGYTLPYIPKEVTDIEIVGMPYSHKMNDLCEFINGKNGDFYDCLEVKILEMED